MRIVTSRYDGTNCKLQGLQLEEVDMTISAVLEGTWEEVSQQSSQLAGKQVRLLVFDAEVNPNDAPPFYLTATPEERAAAFIAWGKSHAPRNAPPLSDEAISRESIYAGED